MLQLDSGFRRNDGFGIDCFGFTKVAAILAAYDLNP